MHHSEIVSEKKIRGQDPFYHVTVSNSACSIQSFEFPGIVIRLDVFIFSTLGIEMDNKLAVFELSHKPDGPGQ